MKREIAGSWNSGPKRGETEIAILYNSKWPENLQRIILEYIKNTGERSNRRGPTRKPHAWGRALPPWARPLSLWGPWQASRAHLPLYDFICPRKKIRRRLSGRSTAVSRRNLGRSTFALRWSDSAEDTSLREGEIEAIDITNDPLIVGGPIFINIFTSTISSKTLVVINNGSVRSPMHNHLLWRHVEMWGHI